MARTREGRVLREKRGSTRKRGGGESGSPYDGPARREAGKENGGRQGRSRNQSAPRAVTAVEALSRVEEAERVAGFLISTSILCGSPVLAVFSALSPFFSLAFHGVAPPPSISEVMLILSALVFAPRAHVALRP